MYVRMDKSDTGKRKETDDWMRRENDCVYISSTPQLTFLSIIVEG